MELYYALAIVDRNKEKELRNICRELQLTTVLTNFGNGTATSEHLLLYDLEQTEKAVVGAVVTGPSLKKFMQAAKREMYIDIPGNGIVLAIPVKSVSGGKNLAFFTDGQDMGGAIPNMDFKYELIIVVLNEGYADIVMDAARKQGAKGGTILHAKGTGGRRAEKFFGVSVAEEKDMIYILASTDKKSEIMKAINQNCGTDSEARAISFSLPVSEVAGLRTLDEES